MEAALRGWAGAEMGLAAGAAPGGPALRRLCSGPCADIWDYVIRHVQNPRNVKKIRGNLLWYRQQLQQDKAPEGSAPAGGGSPTQLRRHLEGLRERMEAEQGRGLALEAAWERARGGPLRRRAGQLRGGAAVAAGTRGRLRRLRGALEEHARSLRSRRQAGEGPPLALALATGMEPPVLAATRSVCALRAAALRAKLEPRPRTRPGTQEAELRAANERWVWAAQALLSRHPPGQVLEALELLAQESGRELLQPRPHVGVPESESEPDPEAPPTVETLIQEHWAAVGELWSRRPSLRPLRRRLQWLLRELRERPGGGNGTRLLVTVAALRGAHAGLAGGVRALTPPTGGASEALGVARGRVVTKQSHLLRRQRQLQTLLGAAAARPLRLPPRRQQAAAAAAALAEAPPALLGAGQRLQGLLGALEAPGEPPRGRRDPLALPPALEPLCSAVHFPLYKAPAALLPEVAERRQRLQRLQGLLGARRREQREQRAPLNGHELAAALAEHREAEATALLPRLRALSSQCQHRLNDWPRLLALVSEWWDPPVQRLLAALPGHPPFSYWLQRWSQAVQGPASL